MASARKTPDDSLTNLKDRSVDELRALLGSCYRGIVNSDRLSAYKLLPNEQRQLCWSHLLRNLLGLQERYADESGWAEHLERSMDRFRTKRIDLMQVHNLVDIENQMVSLREWKTKGRIRYTGITHSQARGFDEVEKAMRTWKPDFVQINYSLMEPEAAQRILPLAQELRMGVIINRPFGGGGLFGPVATKPLPPWAAEIDCRSWAQFFLKWIVAHPAVICVIPATSKPGHLKDNMQGGMGRFPDAKMRQRMSRECKYPVVYKTRGRGEIRRSCTKN